MTSHRRSHRVGERIQSLIAQQLLRVADPRFSLVTITSCVTSPDLRNAKVAFMVTGGPARVPEVLEAFAAAAPMFRRILAAELGMRFVPELRFHYDDSLDSAERMEELFKKVRAADAAREESD